jgi:hypothetical protein
MGSVSGRLLGRFTMHNKSAVPYTCLFSVVRTFSHCPQQRTKARKLTDGSPKFNRQTLDADVYADRVLTQLTNEIECRIPGLIRRFNCFWPYIPNSDVLRVPFDFHSFLR